MMKYTKLFILASIAFFFAFPSSSAHAVKGTTKSEPQERESSSGLFRRDLYIARFIRSTENPADFKIRLFSFGDVTGCAEMSKPEVDITKRGEQIKVKAIDSELFLKDNPRYSEYDCPTSMNRAFFDVPLNRDEMIKGGVKKIGLESETYGVFETAKVDINHARLILSVKSQYGENVLTYWFYPENTVILYAPHAKLTDEHKNLIKEYGIAQGLIPMEKELKGFEQSELLHNMYYFIDPTGKITGQLNKDIDDVQVGTISPTQKIFTANGPVDQPYDLGVFARYPGKDD